MRILVTGSTGFIGSHLCRELCNKGHQVIALHRSTSQTDLIEELPIEREIGDITKPNSLTDPFKGVEVVFHTAAKLGKSTPEETHKVTTLGTRNVLDACLKNGVSRLIHTSSVAALGVPIYPGIPVIDTSREKLNETHSWNYRPKWWKYGYAKNQAEIEIQKAVARGLDAVIVNPALVIGAGDINRISGDIILRVAHGQLRVVTEGGLNVIHILDTIQGHILAMDRGKTGERYILGNENLTHQEFLTKIATIVMVRPPKYVIPGKVLRVLSNPITAIERFFTLPFAGEALHKAGYYFYYDSSKAERDLDLIIQHSTDQAIRDSYLWYKEKQVI